MNTGMMKNIANLSAFASCSFFQYKIAQQLENLWTNQSVSHWCSVKNKGNFGLNKNQIGDNFWLNNGNNWHFVKIYINDVNVICRVNTSVIV